MHNLDLHADLILAIQSGDNSLVKSILDIRCDQVALDSALCWVSRYGNLDVVNLLLQNGANPNAEVWGGFTPILWATMFSPDNNVLNVLIEAGAGVNCSSSKRRQTPLHAAIIRGNHQMVSLLIESGANIDAQDYMYKTPLLHAVLKKKTSGVKVLLHHNCDVNLTGWVNGTSVSPLIQALIQNNLESTKMLILAGAKFTMEAIYQTYTINQYYHTAESYDFDVRPLYLQQQCRICIRNLLKPKFLEKLSQMMLPNALKEFISLAELKYF